MCCLILVISQLREYSIFELTYHFWLFRTEFNIDIVVQYFVCIKQGVSKVLTPPLFNWLTHSGWRFIYSPLKKSLEEHINSWAPLSGLWKTSKHEEYDVGRVQCHALTILTRRWSNEKNQLLKNVLHTYSVVLCVVRTAQNSDEESMVVSNDGPRSRRIGSPFQRQVCVWLI